MNRWIPTCSFFALAVLWVSSPAAPAMAQEGVAPTAETRATASLDDGHHLAVLAHVFGGFLYESTEPEDRNAFVLGRGELGAAWRHDVFGARIDIEAVRSAGPQSLLGIDGNSLVMRLKHGFGQAVPTWGPVRVTARIGLVPDPWIERIDQIHPLRPVSASVVEADGYLESSDLGAELGVSAFDGLIGLSVAFVNGEGRAREEQNPGKNLVFTATSKPLAGLGPELWGAPLDLVVLGGYRDGSVGAGSTRAHRAFAAAGVSHPRLAAGVEWVWGFGLGDRGSVEAMSTGAWLSGEPVARWLGVYGHLAWFDRNLELDADTQIRASAGVYSDLWIARDPVAPEAVGLWQGVGRLRLLVGWQGRFSDGAAAALPGQPAFSDAQSAMVTLEALNNLPFDPF